MSAAELDRFVAELAADLPSPAAGSATAAAVAMAAALVELAARRSGDEETTSRAAELRARVLPLADEDARVYADVLEADGEARTAALARASEIPLEVAEAGLAVAGLAARLVEHGKPSLRGEAVAARELAGAAARAAAELVLMNVGAEDPRAARARAIANPPYGDPI